MLVRLRKGDGTRHGRGVLACRRDDGTQTYVALAHDLPDHDLTHYAIEETLGCRDAFFGLIAQGWDIAAFTRKDPATGLYPAMPPEAMQAETLAVLLQGASRDGTPDAQTLAALAAGCLANDVPPLPVTAEQLASIRERLAILRRRWNELAPGDWLELPFLVSDRQ